jgi:hypothetical protein
MGQFVTLPNPKNPRQKVALGKINGLWGVDKFHGRFIPIFCVKVDVGVVHVGDVPFIHPHELDDQVLVQDVVGTSTLWNWKYVKAIQNWQGFKIDHTNSIMFDYHYLFKHYSCVCWYSTLLLLALNAWFFPIPWCD